jgi:hypothetical protein
MCVRIVYDDDTCVLYMLGELAPAEPHGGDAVTTKMLHAGSSEASAAAETSETKDEAAGRSDDASAEASGMGALDPVATPEREREREELLDNQPDAIDNQPDAIGALDATFTDSKSLPATGAPQAVNAAADEGWVAATVVAASMAAVAGAEATQKADGEDKARCVLNVLHTNNLLENKYNLDLFLTFLCKL